MSAPTRRSFLWGSLATLLLPAVAHALGDGGAVSIAELDLGPGTVARPSAWRRLLYELRHATSVETSMDVARLRPDDPLLFEHPLCVIAGDGGFAMPNDAALSQLSRFLAYGGLLLLDDISGAATSDFDRSARALVDALFPSHALGRLPPTHAVFRTFFLLERPMGRIVQQDWLEGVTVGNVSPLLYTRNDLSGALLRDDSGRELPCVPGGESQRREARKLAMNIVMYCLTSNYKRDQAHVAELLREGRMPVGFSE